MDRQNVKPNRPSLLANSDSSAADRAPAAGRILADVEQDRSRGAVARGLRRRPVLTMAAVASLALCGFVAWRAFDDAPAADADTVAPSASAESPVAATTDDARSPDSDSASVAADTAVIVNDDNPFGGKSVAATPGPNPFGESANPQRTVKRANPFAGAHASEKRAAPVVAKAAPPKPAAAAAAATAAAQKRAAAKVATPVAVKPQADETALGSSLLGNIVTADATPIVAPRSPAVVVAAPVARAAAPASPVRVDTPADAAQPASKLVRPQTGADHEVLDALIQQVDAAGTSGKSDTPPGAARIEPIGVGEPLASADKLQRDLRRCPKANTTAGIDCRIKACRDYGGKNAACAVKH
ncbi:hypothetical protein LVB77_12215 [Lysobacter sp. 5GHs7-4]|uniref:hypothetical protein n=1 Tax=Lysobacter sp. 5GHs7-4 TaxID=2904253 RepID=UPI001E643B70|nr:hypothetical protein [Lysobacter sp. 5GHs7-4]UHQ21448.1 hypothetical protein LVB77_12215 [Lysobacter sp. 5GHs7-4]